MRSATRVVQTRLWSFATKPFEVLSASLRSSRSQNFRLLPLGLTILVSWAGDSQAATQSVALAWDSAANAAGYRLYSGTTSQVYTQQIDVGNVTSTLVSNLINGQTYFFVVTAYNSSGVQSALSNEISYTAGAPTPTPTPSPSPSPTPTATPAATVQVTARTNPVGLNFTVDGTAYTASQIFSWPAGSSHTISTTSTQSGGAGVRYMWTRWSDSEAISHTVAPTKNTTYTGTFTTEYYLTTGAGAGGTVNPGSGWKNSGATVSITATPTNNTSVSYHFSSLIGSGTGSYTGTNNPGSIVMNGPITETAIFIQNPVQVTVQTSIAGPTFSVDGTTYSSAQIFSWQPGSSHTIATISPQSAGTGVRYAWNNWSDGGTMSHTVMPTTNKTYTAKFTTQYFLTMSAGTGGTVTPASGWKNSGAAVSITARPAAGYSFTRWSGTGTGSFSGATNPVNVTILGPISEAATFMHN